MAAIRLYPDEDVRPLLAAVLRDRGYDVLTTAEAGMVGRSDAEYSRTGRSHAGIILSRKSA